jgi:quercetin dioxygenase-like cupin family protein
MTQDQTRRSRPAGETGGSPQRAPQRLVGPVLRFDLAAETEQLRKEKSYQDGRNGKTLVKEPTFRVVLIVLKGGARLEEHHAAAPVSVQTVAGHLRLHAPGGIVDLPAGHLLVLERDVPHDVEALEETAFLLTIAWPEGR